MCKRNCSHNVFFPEVIHMQFGFIPLCLWRGEKEGVYIGTQKKHVWSTDAYGNIKGINLKKWVEKQTKWFDKYQNPVKRMLWSSADKEHGSCSWSCWLVVAQHLIKTLNVGFPLFVNHLNIWPFKKKKTT